MVSNISIFEKNNGIKELSLMDLQTIEGGSLPRDSSSFAHDVGYFFGACIRYLCAGAMLERNYPYGRL